MQLVDELYLHKLVWYRSTQELRSILLDPSNSVRPHPQLEVFFRGVTPLILAIQLGYQDCVQVLLDAGADPLARTELGFSAIQEATSFGSCTLIELLFRERTKRIRTLVESGAETIHELLHETIPDFYIEFKWKFSTMVPFIEKYCPSDYCRLWKRGGSIRMDTTVFGLQEGKLKPKRSNISYIVLRDGYKVPRLFAVDHGAHR
jgi:hypothetical protein